MDLSTSSISNEIEKSIQEEFSVSQAAIDEIRKRREKGQKPESLSNEEIRKGDPVLDTYKVLDDAIHGGMGSVWRVHHESWNVDLAMKRPQPRFFAEAGDGRKEEFIQECENWINLGLHPNIVSCYYVREIGGVPTIFSEWMDNGSLKDRIRDGSLYEGTQKEVQERILDIAIQTARGLEYSHENGLIHQDVKPGNILLTKDWDAKVADFGLAKAQSQLTENEKPVSTGYTIQYCPKEQAEGAPAEKWMDVYAWALTVLEMYAGKRLWDTGTEAKEHGEEYFSQCRISLSTAMQKLIADCLRGFVSNFQPVERILTDEYKEKFENDYPRLASQAAADTAGSLNNKALSFVDLDQSDEAKMLWEKGLAITPNHPESVYNQGLLLWRSGLIDDVELFSRIRRISGEDYKSAEEKIERIKTEGGVLRHFSEDTYNPNAKYVINKEKEEQGKQLACKLFPGESISCVYMDMEQNRLAAGTNQGKLFICDLNGVYKASLIGHSEKIRSVYLYKDLLLSSSHSQVKAWDAQEGRCLSTISGELYFNGFGHIWYDEEDDLIYTQHDINEVSGFSLRKRGEKAAFELSRIQNSSVRLDKDRLFRTICKEVQRLISSGIYGDALQKLQEARQVDGYSRNKLVLDLNEEIGKHCCRTDYRGLYQRISLELTEAEFLNADFSHDGQNLVVNELKGCRYYDINTGREKFCLAKEDVSSADVVNADKSRRIEAFHNRVIIKETSSGRILWEGYVRGNEKRRNSDLQDVYFLADNRILVCQKYSMIGARTNNGIEEYNNLFIIDLETGVEQPVQNINNALRLAVVPDGSFGAVFNYEHDIFFFSTDHFQPGKKMQLTPKYPIIEGPYYMYAGKPKDFKFSLDGRFLLVSAVYGEASKAIVNVFEIDWEYSPVEDLPVDKPEPDDSASHSFVPDEFRGDSSASKEYTVSTDKNDLSEQPDKTSGTEAKDSFWSKILKKLGV